MVKEPSFGVGAVVLIEDTRDFSKEYFGPHTVIEVKKRPKQIITDSKHYSTWGWDGWWGGSIRLRLVAATPELVICSELRREWRKLQGVCNQIVRQKEIGSPLESIQAAIRALNACTATSGAKRLNEEVPDDSRV